MCAAGCVDQGVDQNQRSGLAFDWISNPRQHTPTPSTPAIQFATVAGPSARFVFVYAGQAQVDNAPSCPAYVRPNKLQGHCVTCRNFQSTLSNAIKSCWTCRNINLTFYCPGRGPRVGKQSQLPRRSTATTQDNVYPDSCRGCFICESYGKQLLQAVGVPKVPQNIS
ncbi:LOW QUALITY PROTEIN: uncharacterized protein LOC135436994 [Drosophila montana]|uniref:LOW QUALITY PROTEIN: uncharacterized protein LOC135436994 n=1 Tax=Drosophila montana TaxID=40370 RepID=UPI00313C62BD